MLEKNDEVMENSPNRASKALLEMTNGYLEEGKLNILNAIYPSPSSQLVIVNGIELKSLCEHHLLPFIGKCSIAYIPNEKIIGLSKFTDIVRMYAQRFQLQERLTNQIAQFVMDALQPKGFAIYIKSKFSYPKNRHFCVYMRGTNETTQDMETYLTFGELEGKTRDQIFNIRPSL